jgi:hypothetical protein
LFEGISFLVSSVECKSEGAARLEHFEASRAKRDKCRNKGREGLGGLEVNGALFHIVLLVEIVKNHAGNDAKGNRDYGNGEEEGVHVKRGLNWYEIGAHQHGPKTG